MKLVKCGCGHCRRGIKRKDQQNLVKKLARGARRTAKAKVKRGEEAETRVLLPYTD